MAEVEVEAAVDDNAQLLSENSRISEIVANKNSKAMTLVVCGLMLVGAIILIFLPILLLPAGIGYSYLADAVSADEVVIHLRALQSLVHNADYQNSRSVRLGYNTSRDYVLQVLQTQTNFIVTTQNFMVDTFQIIGTPTLSSIQTNNHSTNYIYGTDFTVTDMSGSGKLTQEPLTVMEGDGCAPPSSTGMSGVLLVIRGNCTFLLKAQNALAQGYSGVLIYNNIAGNVPMGTLAQSVSIPVFLLSYDVGVSLLLLQDVLISMNIQATQDTVGTTNICAETHRGASDSVVVVGAHLDSVDAGPGMNDNGSGSAANLVVAVHFYMMGLGGYNKIRFCWWAAEEKGLKGSKYYVQQAQASGDINNIAAMLNFDMLGSPNFRRGVYDATTLDPLPHVQASLVLQSLFTDWFKSQSINYVLVPLSGRSDYQPFFEASIPVAGLETGAEGLKTVAERALFGGSANVAYDSCYHQACDTVHNVNTVVLNDNVRAIGHVVQVLANKASLRAFLSGSS